MVYMILRRHVEAIFLPILLHGVERNLSTVNLHRATELCREACDAFGPESEIRLVFRLFRHYEVDAPHRVDGHERAINDDLAVHGADEVGGELSEEGLEDARPLMKADDKVAGVQFLHGVRQSRHHIHRPTAVGQHPHVGRRCDMRCALQVLAPLPLSLLVALQHNVDGRERQSRFRTAQHQGEIHQRIHRIGIGKSDD